MDALEAIGLTVVGLIAAAAARDRLVNRDHTDGFLCPGCGLVFKTDDEFVKHSCRHQHGHSLSA